MSAFYSRNQSYSRSLGAESAEEEGRLPHVRAARSLQLSVTAFDAGCLAVGYVSTEWHHVGKYATQVNYYDAEELAAQPEFWRAAAASYKSVKKRTEVLAHADRVATTARESRVAAFRQMLVRHRDCTSPVLRINTCGNWSRMCTKRGAVRIPPIGDFSALAAELERRRDAIAADAALAEFLHAHFESEPVGQFRGHGVFVHRHGTGGQQVNIYGVAGAINLSSTQALATLRRLVAAAEPAADRADPLK